MKLKKKDKKPLKAQNLLYSEDSNILIVAGEQSGDLLGGTILENWKNLQPQINFWGCGGDQMKPYMSQQYYDIDDLATIGIFEILKKYIKLKSYLKNLKNLCIQRKPLMAVFIDFPGFNLRLASQLHELGIACYQIVSPQIWAWHYSRIHKMKKILSGVLCLYDFEVAIYEKENLQAYFIGHPLVKLVNESKKNFNEKGNKLLQSTSKYDLTLALLPGSRTLEIKNHIPIIEQVILLLKQEEKFSKMKIGLLIPAPNKRIKSLIKENLSQNFPNVKILEKSTHKILDAADAGIVCSGTATLECALFKLPFLLIYKTSNITYQIFKRIVRVKFIGMINIIFGQLIVKEFIQGEIDIRKIKEELVKLIHDKKYLKQFKSNLTIVNKKLGHGDPALVAAKILTKEIKNA